ncbi:Uncharacterised protein [Serratia quinivorans]|nr:Uncharacterised protein [Serratia quinivorans]CAI0985874.1 Uncharacterised protein [Serratia quinivorans]CAI1776095.1 Uncharacterised protein [Serratia quinivorans]CAI2105378.1 Uncharacterised protein [Serratia quinivorans]CAI2463451.1 Uncharacterised protein [Serratia quinivorans]
MFLCLEDRIRPYKKAWFQLINWNLNMDINSSVRGCN